MAQTARIERRPTDWRSCRACYGQPPTPLAAEDRKRGTEHHHCQKKLDQLPLNFGARGNVASANIRNPFTFVTLVPGGNISLYSSIKLNGAPLDTFSVRVEGQEANNQRLTIRQDQVQPSVESLEEVSVQTSAFAAEYGQVAGGMFNLVARSGTNQFHGSAFEYFVNEALGAGIPFTNDGKGHLVRPLNRRHNYGFSAGGPVIIPKLYNGRNRTFLFASLEVFRQNESKSGLLQTLPSDAMRNGDFSAALTGRTLNTDPLGLADSGEYNLRSAHQPSCEWPASPRSISGQYDPAKPPGPGGSEDSRTRP